MRWNLAGKTLKHRLLLGTACYPSLELMKAAIQASHTEVITLSIKRQAPLATGGEAFWQEIKSLGCHLLPNTAGCRDAKTAINTAILSRELFATSWIFPTTSKNMAFNPQGVAQLHRWRRTLSYPLVAIGGINLARVSRILSTGIKGIALMSAITQAYDPGTVTRKLLKIIREYDDD